MAKLTTKSRNALADSQFAGPDRSYPIQDRNHAQNALSRASQNASPAVRAQVDRNVHRRYPSMEQEANRIHPVKR